MSHVRPEQSARTWRTADAVHIDVRGLPPPQPMIAILRAIDGGGIDAGLIAHLDREPIFLYPELDERGWRYELLPSPCGGPERDDAVLLRMVRESP